MDPDCPDCLRLVIDRLRAENAEKDRRIAELKKAAKNAVKAWEKLPGGKRYSPDEIGKWLAGPMAKGINALRDVLSGRGSE